VLEATEKVKTQLVPEISALHAQFEAMQQQSEAEDLKPKFNVSNPIKMDD
jgi:hypothetical protein